MRHRKTDRKGASAFSDGMAWAQRDVRSIAAIKPLVLQKDMIPSREPGVLGNVKEPDILSVETGVRF